jgi:hypothetical protein
MPHASPKTTPTHNLLLLLGLSHSLIESVLFFTIILASPWKGCDL